MAFVDRYRAFDRWQQRQQVAVAQLSEHGARGFFLRRATRSQLFIAVFEMLGPLLDDLRLTRRRKLQAGQTFSDFFLPLRHVPSPRCD